MHQTYIVWFNISRQKWYQLRVHTGSQETSHYNNHSPWTITIYQEDQTVRSPSTRVTGKIVWYQSYGRNSDEKRAATVCSTATEDYSSNPPKTTTTASLQTSPFILQTTISPRLWGRRLTLPFHWRKPKQEHSKRRRTFLQTTESFQTPSYTFLQTTIPPPPSRWQNVSKCP